MVSSSRRIWIFLYTRAKKKTHPYPLLTCSWKLVLGNFPWIFYSFEDTHNLCILWWNQRCRNSEWS